MTMKFSVWLLSSLGPTLIAEAKPVTLCAPASSLVENSIDVVVFHSSMPFVPSLALKYNAPLTFVRDCGLLLPLISLTSKVPALLPSLFQSSMPLALV